MTSALILIGYAAAVGVIGSRLLAAADWVKRWPRAAVVTWQLLTVFVVVTVLVAIASLGLGLVQLCKQVAALVHLCVDAMAGVTVTTPSTAAVMVEVGLLGAVLARLGWCLGRTTWEQRRQRHSMVGLLDLLGRRDVALGALVLEHDAAYAFCVPRPQARVVLTSGLLASLSPSEVEAVLLHERAHLQQRHHLVVSLAAVLARAFGPIAPFLRTSEREIARLVELCADDAACRAVGSETVRAALAGLVAGRPVPVLLSASACAVGDRLERLGDASLPVAGRRTRSLALAGFATVVLTLAPAAAILGLVTNVWCLPV